MIIIYKVSPKILKKSQKNIFKQTYTILYYILKNRWMIQMFVRDNLNFYAQIYWK